MQKHDGLNSDELLCCEPAEEILNRAASFFHSIYAPVAQPDRATDSGSVGHGVESYQVYHDISDLRKNIKLK